MIPLFRGLVALVLASTASADPKSSEPANVGQLAALAVDPEAPAIDCAAAAPIVAWAAEHPDGVVLVHGHADARGPASSPRAFARARAVRDRLIGLGVDPDHIITAAFATHDGKVIVWGAMAPSRLVARR
ncbi:hypothetical protein BH11MYX3_BH11MYX3_03300 [soil metagenome]